MMQHPLKKLERIPLLVPDIPAPQDLLPWLEKIHAVRHYSNFGPLVCELESRFSQQFSVPQAHVTTVANATLGLELVLQALALAPGSRVLVPAFTFVATATAVLRAGHIPVLADVDAHSWLLTPDIARQACVDQQLDAVLAVATFGMPHDMQAWRQFEEETGIPVVIDAAAAYGSQWLQGVQGTLVFSLHATKSLPAIEGGVVVSSRPGLAAKVRQLSNFGINLDAGSGLPLGTLSAAGTNAKMSEYHAAVCLASLQIWERRSVQRKALYADLVAEIDRATGGRLGWQKSGPAGGIQAPTLLCAQFPDEEARDLAEQLLAQAHVTTRRWYQPLLSDMAVLQQRCETLPIPNAQQLSRTLLGLPFFMDIAPAQRSRVAEALACSGRRKGLQEAPSLATTAL